MNAKSSPYVIIIMLMLFKFIWIDRPPTFLGDFSFYHRWVRFIIASIFVYHQSDSTLNEIFADFAASLHLLCVSLSIWLLFNSIYFIRIELLVVHENARVNFRDISISFQLEIFIKSKRLVDYNGNIVVSCGVSAQYKVSFARFIKHEHRCCRYVNLYYVYR